MAKNETKVYKCWHIHIWVDPKGEAVWRTSASFAHDDYPCPRCDTPTTVAKAMEDATLAIAKQGAEHVDFFLYPREWKWTYETLERGRKA